MSAPILVIGSFVQDLTFFVERFPSTGETLVGRFATGPGGKGSNQAVAAARAGAKTAFVGAVGHDAFGDGAMTFLTGEGIEQHLLRISDSATGTAGITVNAQGQNQIVVALGACEKFTATEVDIALLEAAEIVVLQFEIHPQTIADLLKLARASGKTTILNPAPMHPAVDFSILANVYIFIPNETEFVTVVQQHPALTDADFTEEKLTSLSAMELHSLCRKLTIPTVIVTLGKRGCFISLANDFELVPACEGIQVIDTTGAGDAFVGGFAAGLIEFGGDIVRAARYANVVAGLSVVYQHVVRRERESGARREGF